MIENQLSPLSKVWVYQSSRAFNEDEGLVISQKIKDFVQQWTSHKLEVSGDGGLVYNRFVILMADETLVGVGGCSIDSSVHFMRSLGQEFRADFLDRWLVAYKKEDEVHAISRAEFEKLVESGEVHDDTIIFNNLIQTKAELQSRWQIPYKQSWLKNLSAAHTSFSSIL